MKVTPEGGAVLGYTTRWLIAVELVSFLCVFQVVNAL